MSEFSIAQIELAFEGAAKASVYGCQGESVKDISRGVHESMGHSATGLQHRSEERRVGKECRSLCDWSSDVCSSDLGCSKSLCLWMSGRIRERHQQRRS